MNGERLVDTEVNILGKKRIILSLAFAAVSLYAIILWREASFPLDFDQSIRILVYIVISVIFGKTLTMDSMIRFNLTFAGAIILAAPTAFLLGQVCFAFFTPTDRDDTVLTYAVLFLFSLVIQFIFIRSKIIRSSIFGISCKICHKRGGVETLEIDRDFVRQILVSETYYTERRTPQAGGGDLIENIANQRNVPYNVYHVTMKDKCSNCDSEAVWTRTDQRPA